MSIIPIRGFSICLIIISGVVIVVVIIIGIVVGVVRVHISNGMVTPIIVVMATVIIIGRVIPVGIKIRSPKSEVP
jgi:hypothetical protein